MSKPQRVPRALARERALRCLMGNPREVTLTSDVARVTWTGHSVTAQAAYDAASSILGNLERDGLAEWVSRSASGPGWRITPKGREALESGLINPQESLFAELERCDRELAAIRVSESTGPAYLPALGEVDWHTERNLIEKELTPNE